MENCIYSKDKGVISMKEKSIEFYPLTHPQKAIWLTEKVYPGTSIANVAYIIKFKGKIDYELLEKSLNLFIKNNDAMRIQIVECDGEPKQYFAEYRYQKFDFLDFSGKTIEEYYKWEEQQSRIPFKLENSELFYCALIKFDEETGGIYGRNHHLIADAWTMTLMSDQVVENYTRLKENIEISTDKKPSYLDYILSEEEYEKSERFRKDKEYWNSKFKTIPEQVPIKARDSKIINAKAKRKTLLVPKRLTAKMHQYCRENKTSIFALFIAALSMYINRITENKQIVLGTTTLNRANIKEKETAGMFSNISCIQINLDSNMDFKTLTVSVFKENLSLLRHQKYPYYQVLKDLRERHKLTKDLFDIVLNYQNTKYNKAEHLEDYSTRWSFNGHQSNNLLIHINDREDEGQLIIDYDYLTDLFHAKELEFIHQHIINLLWHALDDPTKKISRLEMLSEKEKHKILYEFDNKKIIYPKEVSIEILSEELKNGNKCYILDKNLNLMPIGIAGNLYISIPDDNLGSKKEVVDNPYEPGKMLYKTGHMARWFPEGDIQYKDRRSKRNRRQIKETQVKISATFTSEPIEDYIKWWGKKFGHNLKIEFAPYNQVFQELLDPESILSRNKDGINIALIRFEDFIRNDNGTEQQKISRLEHVYEELRQAINKFDNPSPLIIPIFPISNHLEISYAIWDKIDELNNNFKEILSERKNISILDLKDTQKLYQITDVFDEVKDKEAHMPFTEVYYAAIGTQIARKICAIRNQHFKVIVLDCDNTLWKGVCGEEGALRVKIKGAYRELQEFMLQKYNEGMLLAICTKNNKKDVLRVFDKNPEMVLNKNHIVNWKISWKEKSQSIKEIANELNLGLDSFIYIDDNPIECSKMLEKCPEVLTLQLPAQEELIPLFLKHIWAFDKVNITTEDMQRSNMYQAEQKRKAMQETGISLDDYIKNLSLKISMREIEDREIERAAQLTQRTNQFNLSTIRRTKKEIKEFIEDKETKCFVIEASDKFGDYGISGLVIFKEKDEKLSIDTFLLSCRILGRKAEYAVLSGIRKYAKEQGKEELEALLTITAKNKPMQDFIENIKWNTIRKNGKNVLYNIAVSDLPEKIEHIQFYYNEIYKKNSEMVETIEEDEMFALDHVAIAVKDIKEAEKYYKTLGYTISNSVYDPLQNSYLSMCNSSKYLTVELVAPADEKSPSYNIVEMRGESPYHLCYKVSNIQRFLEKIKDIEYETISAVKPAILFNNQKVTFIRIKKVGLIELVETGNQLGSKNKTNKFKYNTIKVLVNDLERAHNFYKKLGYIEERNVKDIKNNLMIVGLIGVDGERIELAAPINKDSVEYEFLKQNGAGISEIHYRISEKEMQKQYDNRGYNIFYKLGENKNSVTTEIDLCNIEMLSKTEHKEYLLPISNYTGKKLLKLPIYDEKKTEITNYEAPRNDIEEKLAEAWKKTLRVERVGINNSFFELGGDSLAIVQLISNLYKKNIEINIQDIYKYPTIGELSKIIHINGKNNAERFIATCEGKIYDDMKLEHTEYTRILSQPLTDLIQLGELPSIDAAALLYDTNDLIISYLRNKQKVFIENYDKPIPYNFIDMGFGTILAIFLPISANELFSEKRKLVSLCKEATKFAGKLGAKVVSLAGLIPSATEYGIDIVQSFEKNNPNVPITIGHATISAGVVLSIERLLDESRRNLKEEKLCIIGLDFTGTLIIKLLLSVLPHPSSIILCDIYKNNNHLIELKKELKEELEYENEISIVPVNGFDLPDKIYDSSIILSAINIPDIIDINKLKLGTLIVDDVWTDCYSKEKAINRFKKYGDILFNDGRYLEVSEPIYRTVYMPEFINNDIIKENQQHFFARNEIVGCILSSLMCAKFDELKPLVGKIDFRESIKHYNKLKQLGFKGASIHCNDFITSKNDIEKFCKIFGSKNLLEKKVGDELC